MGRMVGRRTRRRGLAVPLTLALVVAAGCGDDDDEDGSTGTAPDVEIDPLPATAAEPDPEPEPADTDPPVETDPPANTDSATVTEPAVPDTAEEADGDMQPTVLEIAILQALADGELPEISEVGPVFPGGVVPDGPIRGINVVDAVSLSLPGNLADLDPLTSETAGWTVLNAADPTYFAELDDLIVHVLQLGDDPMTCEFCAVTITDTAVADQPAFAPAPMVPLFLDGAGQFAETSFVDDQVINLFGVAADGSISEFANPFDVRLFTFGEFTFLTVITQAGFADSIYASGVDGTNPLEAYVQSIGNIPTSEVVDDNALTGEMAQMYDDLFGDLTGADEVLEDVSTGVGDDGGDSIRDQFLGIGFTESEADCLEKVFVATLAVDSESASDPLSDDAILDLFEQCGIPLERLAEIGG